MAAVNAADWSVATNGDIRYNTGSTTRNTVLELHRWLMSLLSSATVTGNDLLAVTNAFIPSTRKTDNVIVLNAPYNIDDAAAQMLYNGSIEQDGGNTLYSGLQVVGKTNLATTQLSIVQNNELITNYWTTGANYGAVPANNILLQIMIKTRTGAAFTGSIAVTTGILTVTAGKAYVGQTISGANVTPGTTITAQLSPTTFQTSQTTAAASTTITPTVAADIDGKRIRVQARELGATIGGDEFAYFNVTLGQGVGVAAIFANNDDFNVTSLTNMAGFTGISTAVEGFQAIDINVDGTNEWYLTKWTKGANTTQQLYERMKWITRRGSGTTLFGMNGELFLGCTHSIPFSAITVAGTGSTYNQNEQAWWGSGATYGAGVILGMSTGTFPGTASGLASSSGTFFIQLTQGVAPGGAVTVTGCTSGRAATASSATSRNINAKCFLGNYTGALSGAYGIGVTASELVNADSQRSLADTVLNPPLNVNIIVSGVVPDDVIFAAETKTTTGLTVTGAHVLGAKTLNCTTIPAGFDTQGRVLIGGIEHVYTNWVTTVMTIGGAGLSAALSGGESVSVTQFFTDDFLTAASGNTSGLGTLTIQSNAGLAYPTTGKIRVWNPSTLVYDQYSYTSYTNVNPSVFTLSGTLSTTYQGQKCFVPYIDETATGTSISKTIVYPGSNLTGRMRLYNAASNIVPLELPFTIGTAGANLSAIRTSDA